MLTAVDMETHQFFFPELHLMNRRYDDFQPSWTWHQTRTSEDMTCFHPNGTCLATDGCVSSDPSSSVLWCINFLETLRTNLYKNFTCHSTSHQIEVASWQVWEGEPQPDPLLYFISRHRTYIYIYIHIAYMIILYYIISAYTYMIQSLLPNTGNLHNLLSTQV